MANVKKVKHYEVRGSVEVFEINQQEEPVFSSRKEELTYGIVGFSIVFILLGLLISAEWDNFARLLEIARMDVEYNPYP